MFATVGGNGGGAAWVASGTTAIEKREIEVLNQEIAALVGQIANHRDRLESVINRFVGNPPAPVPLRGENGLPVGHLPQARQHVAALREELDRISGLLNSLESIA
jgi:hypothetical protein